MTPRFCKMHCAGFPAAPFTTIVIVEGGWIIVIGKLATETRAGNVGLVHVMLLGICYVYRATQVIRSV